MGTRRVAGVTALAIVGVVGAVPAAAARAYDGPPQSHYGSHWYCASGSTEDFCAHRLDCGGPGSVPELGAARVSASSEGGLEVCKPSGSGEMPDPEARILVRPEGDVFMETVEPVSFGAVGVSYGVQDPTVVRDHWSDGVYAYEGRTELTVGNDGSIAIGRVQRYRDDSGPDRCAQVFVSQGPGGPQVGTTGLLADC